MTNNNINLYGKEPYQIAVIHGGPGAPGEMAPVAIELSKNYGVLEPLQTKATITGQIEELKQVLKTHGQPPITLIGFSWGAMLSYLFTANNPTMVKKLILVSSAVFEEKYAMNIMNTRLSRLSEDENLQVSALLKILGEQSNQGKDKALSLLGKYLAKADSYDLISSEDDGNELKSPLGSQYDIYEAIWNEAKDLRSSGKFVALGKKINCPVVAIHGDYDPHPPEGVSTPLSKVIKHFKFILLKNCGHLPWLEKQAKDKFFDVLKKELT
jgi:pimeloyl-ACP methyl ester carboxylesterase